MKTIVVDGQAIAKSTLDRTLLSVNAWRQRLDREVTPKLAIVTATEKSDAASYLLQKRLTFDQIGFGLEVAEVKNDHSKTDVLKMIDLLNKDPSVSGIITYLPLTKSLQKSTKEILSAILPSKDVECLTPRRYRQMLACDITESVEDCRLVLPCTVLACMAVLDTHKIRCLGKQAVVLGNGYATGYPIATMLAHRGARVVKCDHNTQCIDSHIHKADILVSATGKPDMFDINKLKEGVHVLDVGICLENGKIRGDIKHQDLLGKANLVTPVPKGIGPITSSMVVRNLTLLWETSLKKQLHETQQQQLEQADLAHNFTKQART